MSFMYGQGEDQIDRCFYFQDTYMLPFRYPHSIYGYSNFPNYQETQVYPPGMAMETMLPFPNPNGIGKP